MLGAGCGGGCWVLGWCSRCVCGRLRVVIGCSSGSVPVVGLCRSCGWVAYGGGCGAVRGSRCWLGVWVGGVGWRYTLCYNDQMPNPCRWVWLTVVLANMKNKSSWLALYIWVWGSRKNIGYHFQTCSDITFRVRNQPRKRSSSGNITVALNKVRPR